MATTRKTATKAGSGTKKKAQRQGKRSGGSKKAAIEPTAPMIKTFPSAVKALLGRPNIERLRPGRIDGDTFKLVRMEKLLQALDNPHEALHAVHIAGTMGKGSTAAMLQSMLQGCGWTTGTYTSPHLIDIRERIAINGEMISQATFTDLAKRVAEAADKAAPDASFFELMTAMAFLHFEEEATDIAIVETGLGGRLDATNLIKPAASLITRIDLDHQHLLGNTLAEIAKDLNILLPEPRQASSGEGQSQEADSDELINSDENSVVDVDVDVDRPIEPNPSTQSVTDHIG